ncbi:MAG: hypothetical protein EOO06_16910 [Chitinophagaceae bacterium]|nr:MAG: hypothetical protein EOO06_16910 [Chitinophagaceae bacterium]
MKIKPYSSALLALSGLLLAAMGVYFIFLRPSILPEDLRYMGSTPENIKQNVPGLFNWLQKVFWVMGGYIFTAGLLTVFVSVTSFRNRVPGAFSIVALAGISSIGLMTVVNFIISSDFRWLLLIFTMPWATALILYRFHK